ncbi:MAG: peptidylprolyl isomerase [Bacteroidales bacterium]|nr:peptidylprolyl isomerase [Bacteroidales bacterium]
MKKVIYVFFALALLAGCKGRSAKTAEAVETEPTDTLAAVKAAQALPEEPIFDIVTNYGTIRVKLYKDTPRHRDNFEKLALSGYYDSLLFHRVINGFMIQGGDPFTRDTSMVDHYGEGGPAYTIPAEMRDSLGQPLHRHKKGALAAARRGDLANPFKESSGSQFYLVQDPDNCAHLDGEYTVFGETIAGLHVIDKIASVPTNRRDLPLSEVKIVKIRPNSELNSKKE